MPRRRLSPAPTPTRLKNETARAKGQTIRSAGFQPAVSPISNRQALAKIAAPECSQRWRIGNPRYSRLEVCATLDPAAEIHALRCSSANPAAARTTALAERYRSAGFQPAVSPIPNRPALAKIAAPECSQRWRIGNPRYGRLEVCATLHPAAQIHALRCSSANPAAARTAARSQDYCECSAQFWRARHHPAPNDQTPRAAKTILPADRESVWLAKR